MKIIAFITNIMNKLADILLLDIVKQIPKSLQLALAAEIEFLNLQVSSDKKSGKKLGKVKEKLYSKLNYRTENYIEKVDDKSVLRE